MRSVSRSTGWERYAFAAEIRKKVGVSDDPQVIELIKVFERHIESRRAVFKASRSEDCVIPELRQQFEREGLSLLPPEDKPAAGGIFD